MNQRTKGFTLIELLVVIAIIGILSSVVLASLNGARVKARDVKRISDVKSLQLALELYFDANGKYPGILTTSNDLAPTYISVIPTPPTGISGVSTYNYVPLNAGGGTCNSYHLGTPLEQNTNTVLTNDSDATPGLNGTTVATSGCGGTQASGPDFNGLEYPTCTTSSVGTAQPGGTEACYDVTP